MNENTAHSDLAGEIRVAEGIRDRLRIAAENARPLDTDLSDQWAAEAAALTLLIDAVRGYEAMLSEADMVIVMKGGKSVRKEKGERSVLYDELWGCFLDEDLKAATKKRVQRYDTPLAAFRAVAKEGDE
jgi:hypothetical protein